MFCTLLVNKTKLFFQDLLKWMQNDILLSYPMLLEMC
jgi:hypothetical protein